MSTQIAKMLCRNGLQLMLLLCAGVLGGARPVAAQELPRGGALYFLAKETIFVGEVARSTRGGKTCLVGRREGEPERELLLIASQKQTGSELTLSYVNLHRGAPETTGYLKLSALQTHPELGTGHYGTIVQTHAAVNGKLQPERQPKSDKIFLQVASGAAPSAEPEFEFAPSAEPEFAPSAPPPFAPSADRDDRF